MEEIFILIPALTCDLLDRKIGFQQQVLCPVHPAHGDILFRRQTENLAGRDAIREMEIEAADRKASRPADEGVIAVEEFVQTGIVSVFFCVRDEAVVGIPFIHEFADARSRQAIGYDDNDYDYIVLPNAEGTSCSVYRNRMVDWQLGLGTSQEKAGTFAKDIPTRFTRNADGYVYEVFFPAKHILPIQLKKGYAFGLGIHVPNADDPELRTSKRMVSALTNSGDGIDCFNKPHLWPAVVLE